MNEELEAKLERFKPMRVVLRLNADMQIEGRTEHSFVMDWVAGLTRIWWSGKAYSLLGEHKLDGVRDAEYNSRSGSLIFDPLHEDCPVTIDWERWLEAMAAGETRKFDSRNARFTVKPHGVWQMRALTAEDERAKLLTKRDQLLERTQVLGDRIAAIEAILNPSDPQG